jgi:hypothetical protein
MKIEWEQKITGKCTAYSRVPKGARIIAIDDMEVVGRCEGCGKYLTDADSYEADGEGIYLCTQCATSISHLLDIATLGIGKEA